jgi:hypothetical protein
LDFSGDQHVGLIFINHKQKGYLLEVKEEEIDGEEYEKQKRHLKFLGGTK